MALTLLGPAAIAPTSAAPPKAPKTIAITPHITWSATGPDCPAGTRDLETRVMPVPPREESTSEVWFADYPVCATHASKSCGINRQPNPPRFPIFLSKEVECIVGANGEQDRSCTPMGDVCRSRFTVTLTSELRCQCDDLDVRGTRGRVTIGDPDRRGRTHLRLRLDWTLFCAQYPGGCEGEFDFVIPRVWRLKFETPRRIPVSCEGTCDPGPDAPFAYLGQTRLHLTSGKALSSERRAGRELNIVIRKFCFEQDGDRVLEGTRRIKISFGPRGFVDLRQATSTGSASPTGRGVRSLRGCGESGTRRSAGKIAL